MKVRITLSAYTRREYTTTVEVPDDAAPGELDDLAEAVYEEVDGGEYVDDQVTWDKGELTADPIPPEDGNDRPAEFKAVRDPDALDGWQLTPVPTDNGYVTKAFDPSRQAEEKGNP